MCGIFLGDENMARKLNKSQNNNSKVLKSAVIGSFVGVGLCIVLLILSALALTKSSGIPHLAVSPLVMIIAGVGAFGGGYISAGIAKQNGMLCGIMCGFIMFIILFIAGLVAARTTLTMATVVRFILMLLAGAVGGIVGVNKRQKIKY